ncbi:MAG: SGNH/GDSL hydrolase family protein [Deltaproteobacteria bacterium]|nr:SGNH/GDSL hydrolase family protein [Deltaproteobacteria bacterium]
MATNRLYLFVLWATLLAAVAGSQAGCSSPETVAAGAKAAETGSADTAGADAADAADATAPADTDPVDSATTDAAETDADGTQGAAPQRVLFVGNSYTYVNDLPAMTAAFAAHATPPQTWEVGSSTLGGAFLVDHLTKTDAVAQIAKATWTWVVLQGQSLEPAGVPASFEKGASQLSTLVHKTPAQLAFYTTWPRKAGSEVYDQAFSGGTPAALFAKLKAELELVATQNQGVRVPVGDAWMVALQDQPGIELYQADGSHPTVAGTYLAACVFAVRLGGVDAKTVNWQPEGVPAEQGQALRKICAEVAGQ